MVANLIVAFRDIGWARIWGRRQWDPGVRSVVRAGGRVGDGRRGRVPAGRVPAEPEAFTIGFLLRPSAGHVRGAAWVVDGGVTVG